MDHDRLRKDAHRLVDLGYALVPLRYGRKTPVLRWKSLECNHDAVEGWLRRFGRLNLAIQAGRSGIVGLDADSPEAVEWIERECPRTPMVAGTPRGGMHAYFRAPDDAPPPAVNLLGIGLDVRSRRSMLVAAPSWCATRRRGWEWRGEPVPVGELPVLPSGLLPRRPRTPGPAMPAGGPRSCGAIRDVTRWIMRVESVQGQNGSGQCFRVACKLVGSGMDRDRAWATLLAWNDRCAVPPWSEKELAHKLQDAFERFR